MDIKKLIEEKKEIEQKLEKYYLKKIEEFKKEDIEKYNPYQAEKLPSKKELMLFIDQLRAQVIVQVRAQVRDQVWAQVWDQVGAQVRYQVWGQVGATSYWGVKIALDLPIKHWFFDFLKLGVMIVFVKGKVKVFGKEGKYLGEYDESDFKK